MKYLKGKDAVTSAKIELDLLALNPAGISEHNIWFALQKRSYSRNYPGLKLAIAR